jgi:hypothetical protein
VPIGIAHLDVEGENFPEAHLGNKSSMRLKEPEDKHSDLDKISHFEKYFDTKVNSK